MRISNTLAVLACAMSLAGCSGQDANQSVVLAESVASSTTTSSAQPTTTTTAAPATQAETMTTTEPLEQVQEPVVVECLFGTPGPARWSDGTTRYSQWCFDQLGGDEYLRSEREANTFECDGVVCRNPYTGVTYPDPDAQESAPVGTTSDRGYSCYEDGCYWPDGSFVPNAERCGSLCGEPPTSAELQTRAGCEAGWIADPALCGRP